ncbi:MAG: GrpB family protein [Acidobacteriota bacterium]
METTQQKIQRLVSEEIALVPYNPAWPDRFRQEKDHLLACLPTDLVRRVEHLGRTYDSR